MKFEKVSAPTFWNDQEITPSFNLKLGEELSLVSEIYKSIKLPQRATQDSVGYDFFSPFGFSLVPGESLVIPTGIKAILDNNVGLFIFPRSGQGFNFFARLANTIGVIDPRYYGNPKNEGHIMVKIRNESTDGIMRVDQGQAFCQGVLIPYLTTDDDNPLNLDKSKLSGFGSTDSLRNKTNKGLS